MPLTALKLFKNESDETRLGIVLLLWEMGELCVCDLCTALDESQPNIARYLSILRESGLVGSLSLIVPYPCLGCADD